MVKFAALLYVNRSGSTLFSRFLAQQDRNIFVLPEVEFPLRLIANPHRKRAIASGEILNIVRSDPRFDALKITDEQLREICEPNKHHDLPEFLLRLSKIRIGYIPDIFVFKLENLIYFWSEISDIFGDITFIHMVRDPRAVVCSKIRTPVPEKPGFDMARGDIFHAAKHWRNYIRLIDKIGQHNSVVTIRYEDLIANPASVLEKITDGLGLPRRGHPPEAGDGDAYALSELDLELHQNVFKDFQTANVDRWMDRLSNSDVQVIETLCWDELQAFGYRPNFARQPTYGALMMSATARHWGLSLLHQGRTLLRYVSRRDGAAALVERLRIATKAAAALNRRRRKSETV